MHNSLFYPLCTSSSGLSAVQQLAKAGIPFTDHPRPEITHLLLDIPSFQCSSLLSSVLPTIPESVTVIGGKLPSELSCAKADLLEDPFYLAENAAITAECALRVAAQKLPCTLRNADILVIGWGRIGKQLCKLLKALGARVSVCSRSVTHQAEITAFGLLPVSPTASADSLASFRAIFNTAPGVVLSQEIPDNMLKIELASLPGISGENVIHASGLPGRYAPESSGTLIARTILRKLEEGTL